MSIIQSLFDFLNSFVSSPPSIIALVAVIFLVFYFLPSLIASARHKKQSLAIFLLNLFAGWTFIGWLAALIWAAIIDKSDYEDIKHKERIKQISTENKLANKSYREARMKTQRLTIEPSNRKTIKDILTKKRSIRGILTQKLW